MAGHTPVQDDPKQLEEAQKFWVSFTSGAKWGIVTVAGILIFLALAFVPHGA